MDSYKQIVNQTKQIANDYLNNNNIWQTNLSSLLVTHAKEMTVDDETTFSFLVRDLKEFVFETVEQAIEENIYEFLSQQELFDEERWTQVSQQFHIALENYINQNADNIIDIVFDEVRDDIQYSKNKNRYFGTSNDDF